MTQILRSDYRPLFCSQIKGSIQGAFSLSFFHSLSKSHNKTRSVFSHVAGIMRIFPKESLLHMLFSLFDRFLCCKQKSYMLQRCVNARQKRKYVVSKNTPRLTLKLKLGGLVKKNINPSRCFVCFYKLCMTKQTVRVQQSLIWLVVRGCSLHTPTHRSSSEISTMNSHKVSHFHHR